MTTAQYGMFASIAGAAFAAWWWNHSLDDVARGMTKAGCEHDRLYRP